MAKRREGSSSHLVPSENAVRRSQVSISVQQGTPSISVRIGELTSLLIDTGYTVLKCDLSVTFLKPFGATGEVLDVKGRQFDSLEVGDEFHHTFLVGTLPTEAAGIIGTES